MADCICSANPKKLFPLAKFGLESMLFANSGCRSLVSILGLAFGYFCGLESQVICGFAARSRLCWITKEQPAKRFSIKGIVAYPRFRPYWLLSCPSFRLFIYSRCRLQWHNRSVVLLLFFERPCSIEPQTACAALGRVNLQPLGAIKVTQSPAESMCAPFDPMCQPASYHHLQFALHTRHVRRTHTDWLLKACQAPILFCSLSNVATQAQQSVQPG